MIFQTTKIPLTDLNAVDIVQQAKEERQACKVKLSARIKKKLEGRVASFVKVHKLEHQIQEAANQGLNHVRIPIQQKFGGGADLSEPIEEMYDGQYDVRVMYNHNAFFAALEAHVFSEENIEGHFEFSSNDATGIVKATALIITWEALMPSPVTLDLLWDANHRVSDFVEGETLGDMIERLNLKPRDGTPLVARCGRRRVGHNSLVATYCGKTLVLRPEGMEPRPDGVDL